MVCLQFLTIRKKGVQKKKNKTTRNTNLDGRYPDCVVVTWVIPSLLGSDVLTDIGEFGLEVVLLLKQKQRRKLKKNKIVLYLLPLNVSKKMLFLFYSRGVAHNPFHHQIRKQKNWIKRFNEYKRR